MSKRLQVNKSFWKHDLLSVTKVDIKPSDLKKPWFIICPENTYMEYFSKFMTILLAYTAIVTPYRIAFIDYDDFLWKIIDYIVTGFFVIDFGVNCVLAFYDSERILITAPKKILLNYLFSWMIIDFFACIPFSQILESDKQLNSIVRIARLPRLYRIIKITKLLRLAKVIRNGNKILKHISIFLKISASFERIFWFTFTYFLLIHLVSCMWVFMAKIDTSSVNWILINNFQDNSNNDLYIVSLYWTVTTMATVGYGDIVAVNVSEKIYVSVVMTLGIIFYSYLISSLTTIFSNLDVKQSKLNQQYLTLDIVATKFKISKSFYQQISEALEYVYKNKRLDVEEILQDLPQNLANQVLVAIYEKKIKNNVFFDKKSTEFVAWVAQRIKLFKCAAKTMIYQEQEYASQVYFIIQGKVEFLIHEGSVYIPYLELESDYYFGEIDMLFSDKKLRIHNVRAVVECEMLTLNKENFFLLLETFEAETVQICVSARERLERTNRKYVDALCEYQSNQPITKSRSIPRRILSGTPEASGEESPLKRSDGSHKINLFNKIIETKLKVKDTRIRNIMRKVEEMEKDSLEAQKLVEKIKELMNQKYPEFKIRYY